MKNINKFLVIFASALTMVLTGCYGKDQIKKALEENPDILTNAIEKNPTQIMEALNTAVRTAQRKQFEDREKEQEKERESEFANPKTPKIDDKRAMRGKNDAPITIVEYSDFECPFCKKGYDTMKEVKSKYGDKIRFIFKHLPLDFHPMAMPAAKYFEAIALQSPEKAYAFHDIIYSKQEDLKSKKEDFLKKAAKEVGADMGKLKSELDSDVVKQRIQSDMDEAKTFGFTGTPGFLVNGVSIRGAYGADEFAKIIDRQLSKK